MKREPLVFVGTCDLAGLVRGKGFPAAELAVRLRRGIGLTHSNIMMSPFGPIYDTPFGTAGDLMLVPDTNARVEVEFDEYSAAERFYLGDLMTTDEQHWECCPRHFLRRALFALHQTSRQTGINLLAAFEQEFVYTGVEDRPGATYALDAYRRQGLFAEHFIAALREAGLNPDSFLPEYGSRQYEVTIHPTRGLRAADEAVIQREIARAVAYRLGYRAVFAPILDPGGVGNGTHIHFSLRDGGDHPLFYDPGRPYRLTLLGEHFVAGVLHHLPALTAITAPSPVSYYRLRPNRWAPTWANIAVAGPRRRDPGLPGLRVRRRGASIQHRIPRRRCRGEPVSGIGRAGLGRGRRHPQQPLAAADQPAEFLGHERFRAHRRRHPPAAALARRGARRAGGVPRGARMVRRDVLRRLSALQAGRVAGRRGADRGRDLRPLRRNLLGGRGSA